MRDGGGGGSISPRCLQTQWCVLGVVVGVDEIMQRPGVIRMTGVYTFKEFGSLLLLLESLGTFRNSPEDGQPIEQRSFVIRILGIRGGHRDAVVLVAS